MSTYYKGFVWFMSPIWMVINVRNRKRICNSLCAIKCALGDYIAKGKAIVVLHAEQIDISNALKSSVAPRRSDRLKQPPPAPTPHRSDRLKKA